MDNYRISHKFFLACNLYTVIFAQNLNNKTFLSMKLELDSYLKVHRPISYRINDNKVFFVKSLEF